MSRIGKKPVELPKGVTAEIKGQQIEVKGPKGTRSFTATDDVDPVLKMAPSRSSRAERPACAPAVGMTRSMIENLTVGVSIGFKKELEIRGVGYRANMQGKDPEVGSGYSHDVIFEVPEGVTVSSPKQTEIVVEGIDQQLVGQVAANIREWRKPEPYKGKGIRYKGEYVFRKEGKKK